MDLSISASPAAAAVNHGSKHFPARGCSSTRRTRNYIIRAAAKRYANNNNVDGFHYSSGLLKPVYSGDGDKSASIAHDARRPLMEKKLREHLPTDLGRNGVRATNRGSRSRVSWDSALTEARALATSNLLPANRTLVRRPTLEREDAFRDATTAKGKVHVRQAMPVITGDEDEQIAQLYRMGLLYDDDERTSREFDLNSIKHDEPLFSIRPSKRARKTKVQNLDNLTYSFSDMGPSTLSEPHAGEDEEAREDSDNAPMRVIYELRTSSPSFDVDTSQPPDLIDDDIMSDYDCLSEGEWDDETPSQHEVYDGAALPSPSGAWIMLGDGS